MYQKSLEKMNGKRTYKVRVRQSRGEEVEEENKKKQEQGYGLLERKERWGWGGSFRERALQEQEQRQNSSHQVKVIPCKEPVEIKILQPYCYQSSAHRTMHILFEEQTLVFHSSW